MQAKKEEAKFGFTPSAENLNGRMAMIGFVALLIQEVLTGHGIVGFISNL